MAVLGLVASIAATLSIGAQASAAACPPQRSGTWIGSYSYTDFSGAYPVWGDLSLFGNQLTGTGHLSDGDPGSPIHALISCDRVTGGTFAGANFEGTIAPDGASMSGTWSIPGSVAGTWSSGLAVGRVSTEGTELTTDPGTGATPADPLQVGVISPVPGSLVIEQASAQGATISGYQMLDHVVHITAPSTGSAATPLQFTFELDASVLVGVDAAGVAVFRNSVAIVDCAGPPGVASPNPCISARADLPGGNVAITVLTTDASNWSFGIAPSAIAGPAVFAGKAAAVEGSSGKAHTVQIPVTLNEPLSSTVSVNYAVTSGTGVAGTDFTAKKGKLVFKPSARTGLTPTTKYVTVKLIGDQTPESAETMILTLSSPSPGLSVAYANGIGTIVDDDGTLDAQIGVGDGTVYEGDSSTDVRTVKLSVSRSTDVGSASVRYDITGLGAVAGADFIAPSAGTITFKPGQTQRTVTIKVWGDTQPESGEVVQVHLFGAVGATIVKDTGQLTIADDD